MSWPRKTGPPTVTSGPLTSAGLHDPIGAHLGEVWRHGELAGIDRMKLTDAPHPDFGALMQPARRVVDVGIARGHDVAALDHHVREMVDVDVSEGRNDLGQA